MTLGRDILDNFETWPEHIQASFLEIVSQQVMEDAQMERFANLTYLGKLLDDFQAVLPVFSSRTSNLVEEIAADVDSYKLLQELPDRVGLVSKLEKLALQVQQLRQLLSK